ncbi:MAG: hypothetical protein HQL23_02700 [Candidatus Omnitrophica bacterium]|nr:hypothetical protein [Candidatus Omnitrophota bacterium]
MKTFFMKIFLVIAAGLCMFEGLVLLAVGLGRLSPDRLVTFYNQLLQQAAALKTIQGVGSFFVALGFLLLLLAARAKPAAKTIAVEQDGKILTIPQKTVMDFIQQIGEQNPFVTYFRTTFEQKPKQPVTIAIIVELSGVPSVHQVLQQIENTLIAELDNVFAWHNFKFDFRLQGLVVNPKKKYFPEEESQPAAPLAGAMPPAAAAEKAAVVEPAPETSGIEILAKEKAQMNKSVVLPLKKTAASALAAQPAAEEIEPSVRDTEEEQLFDSTGEKAAKPSFLSKVLWGK